MHLETNWVFSLAWIKSKWRSAPLSYWICHKKHDKKTKPLKLVMKWLPGVAFNLKYLGNCFLFTSGWSHTFNKRVFPKQCFSLIKRSIKYLLDKRARYTRELKVLTNFQPWTSLTKTINDSVCFTNSSLNFVIDLIVRHSTGKKNPTKNWRTIIHSELYLLLRCIIC